MHRLLKLGLATLAAFALLATAEVSADVYLGNAGAGHRAKGHSGHRAKGHSGHRAKGHSGHRGKKGQTGHRAKKGHTGHRAPRK
jgi:hypothetical protein